MAEFEKSLQSICDNMVKTASYAINYLDEDKRQKALHTLRVNIEAYIKSAKTLKNINSLMQQSLSRGDNDHQKLLEEFNQKTSSLTPDITGNKYLKEYDDSIKELMKNLAGVVINSDDAEMEITDEGMQSYANLTCPISKTKMTEPMKNTVCGHIYDKASVTELIRNNPHTRCPVIGCSNKEYLKLSDIKSDIVKQICIDIYTNEVK